MNHVDTIAPTGRQDGNEEAIAPFRIDVPDADRDDLRTRLALARWPDAPGASDWSRGVPADYLRNLADYWRDAFDWRMQEDRLNAWPQFTTVIDGQVIHFVHVRSREPDALPLILTHGWPSSFIELTNLIGPLVDPVAHGGDARDAFDVVIPSLPGFGYSNPVNGDGRGNIFAIAMMWDELMRRLGYERYAAQGGDIGAGVTSVLGVVAPHRVVATHVTGPVPFPFGPALEVESFSGRDRLRAERFNQWQRDGIGYLHLQATRPQTIGYSLVDSPTGLLAWIVEKVREWTDPAADLPEEAVDRDQLLATVSLYWFTRSGASSAKIVYEGMQAYRAFAEQSSDGDAGEWDADRMVPPHGVAVFAADNSIRGHLFPHGGPDHWSEFDRGGHFPAMETPDLLVDDIRAFTRSYRQGGSPSTS